MDKYQAKTEIAQLRSELRSAEAKLDAEQARRTPATIPKAAARPENWTAACEFIARRDGCSLSEAGTKAAQEYPQLHPIAARGRR